MFEKKISFSEKGAKEMKNLTDAITEILNITFSSFLNDDADTALRVEPLEQVIDRICLKMKERHAARLQKGKCTISQGYVFNDLIADFERVSDHCSNIAIVIVDLMSNSLDVHELSDAMHENRSNRYQEYYEAFQIKYMKRKDWEMQEENPSEINQEDSLAAAGGNNADFRMYDSRGSGEKRQGISGQ